MKITTKLLASAACALAAAFWMQAQAGPGPQPGKYNLAQPGQWQEVLLGGSDAALGNTISATDGLYYKFEGATKTFVTTLPTGSEWMYFSIYEGGTLTLNNVKGAPWYKKNVPEGTEFVFNNVVVYNLTRHYSTGLLEFDLTGYAGGWMIHGTYSGSPTIIPDGADYWVSGPLATAQVWGPGLRVGQAWSQ
jgi:hypothetical protein